MEVDWIATDPETRRLSYVDRRTSADEFVARMEALGVLGEGYSEVHLADRAYPLLAWSFRGGYGVIHLAAEDKIFLLAGDGSIANDQTVLVPGLDNSDSEFTGAVVLSVDHAWAVVREFIRHGSVEDLGNWLVRQHPVGC